MGDDYKTLGIMEGIATGMEKLTFDLQSLSLAKEKLKREREEYEKQSKITDYKLKALELELGPEKVEQDRKLYRAKTKAAIEEFNTKALMQSKVGEELERAFEEGKNLLSVSGIAQQYLESQLPSAKKKYTDSQVRTEAKRIAKERIDADPRMGSEVKPTSQQILDAIPAARDFLNKSTQKGSAQSAFEQRYNELEEEGLSEQEIFEALKEEGI